jgi:hypothetical protein
VTKAPLDLTREQILAYRRKVNELDERLPPGADSLRRAAWAGLQDSMPRAALLSIHARVEGTQPSTWEDPSLVQLWGPRFSVYVVPAVDHAVFSLGRMPPDGRSRRVAEEMAANMGRFLGGRRLPDREVGDGLGVGNGIRYAGPTGTVLIRWEGARSPTIWTVPAPQVEEREAWLELARRYLHIFGPTTPEAFALWAGIGPQRGTAAFDELAPSLTAVRTPIGEAWILTGDEAMFRAKPRSAASARLLPSGDAYWLMLQGRDREFLVPDADRRAALWTPRVWPGALLVSGEIVGTWRRANTKITVELWRALSQRERDAVEAEAASLPLPGARARIQVRWLG